MEFWDEIIKPNEREREREESGVTVVTAGESARQPSSGPSEPVRTTPSANGSEAATIYLRTELDAVRKLHFITQRHFNHSAKWASAFNLPDTDMRTLLMV